VQAQLEAAGLTVTQKDADDAELARAGTALDAGDVAGLRPSGVLAVRGTAVVLYVAQEAYDPGSRQDKPSSTSAATTTPAPTTTSRTTTPPPPANPTTSTSTSIASGSSEAPPSDPPVDPQPGADAPAPGGAG
jgi:hypothetical protein